ncbi:hypothetical protein TNCT_359991 [Trichonephila clavata]|uniref:Uncharacterized protein n=1 Tax=Trichonephila clavata TaxID=2740835 RepID=A0A8X6IU01_TRICU|nr:hypothetical protein TNCT_359991 [Trichonephila clavata]
MFADLARGSVENKRFSDAFNKLVQLEQVLKLKITKMDVAHFISITEKVPSKKRDVECCLEFVGAKLKKKKICDPEEMRVPLFIEKGCGVINLNSQLLLFK